MTVSAMNKYKAVPSTTAKSGDLNTDRLPATNMHFLSCQKLLLLLLFHKGSASFLANCSHPTSLYTQKVNHDSVSGANGTFQQQYQMISDFYRPGGPILFYQGAENAEFVCLENLILPSWARETGALVVGIEHRFFGISNPSNASDPIRRFESLTLENVMADSVELLASIKATNSSLASAKVIVTGGELRRQALDVATDDVQALTVEL